MCRKNNRDIMNKFLSINFGINKFSIWISNYFSKLLNSLMNPILMFCLIWSLFAWLKKYKKRWFYVKEKQ